MSQIIEHLTDQDFLTSKDGVQHPSLGNRIGNIEKELKPLKIRYVREWLNGNNKNDSGHWVEVEVYNKAGENIALNKPVSASRQHPQTDTYGNPNKVTDGDKSDYFDGFFDSDKKTPCNICIDLEGVHEDISHINVWHYYTDGRTYNEVLLEVSEDGDNWTTIFDSSVEGTYAETKSGKTHKVDSITALNTKIKQNIKEIQDIRNRLNNLKSFYDVSLLEMDYELSKEKLTYYLATYGLGE